MPSYQEIRTQKALPIGSVMPWPGTITRVPSGWLFCNGAEVQADEYPLLARILRDSYGGSGFGGEFPNYLGTVRLPNLNQKALSDIGEEHFESPSQPNPPSSNIDDAEALSSVLQYIGQEGDLGPPSSVFATTDIVMVYTPDPDGFIDSFDYVGIGPAGTGITTFSDLNEFDDGIFTSGVGTGARFNVLLDNAGNFFVSDVNSGEGYAQGDTITIPGTAFASVGGVTPDNDIVITVNATGNSLFKGSIEDQSFIPGFDARSVYVVPRKLGRNHLAQHIHPGTYETINRGDSTSRPGTGVGIWTNPQIVVNQALRAVNGSPVDNCFISNPNGPIEGAGTANFWEDQTGPGDNDVTVGDSSTPHDPNSYGRYALGYIGGSKPARTHIPFNSATAAHGIGKPWFTSAVQLVSRTTFPNESAELALTRATGNLEINQQIPWSDETQGITSPNYTPGIGPSGQAIDNPETYKTTLYNIAAVDPLLTANIAPGALDVIAAHDHESEFLIFYDQGSLNIKTLISADCQPNVIPDSIPEALQITFTVTSPSLSITNIIRAY